MIPEENGFRRAVLRGLSAPDRHVPCQYLWDAAGCALFDRICTLDEYYLTRCEVAILQRQVKEIARLIGPGCRVVEFGSGSGVKSRLLLEALDAPLAYVPVDVAVEALAATRASLAGLRDLTISPICADFLRDFDLPTLPDARTLGFFPGSTIGNLRPAEAARFLARVRTLIGDSGALVVGVDLRKDPARIRAAYADRDGVTAAFNRNLLVRINRELEGTFAPHAFSHDVRYDPATGRLELRLTSDRPQRVLVGTHEFAFKQGDSIHTEDSWKYDVDAFHDLAHKAGLGVRATWLDDDELFSVHYLEPR